MNGERDQALNGDRRAMARLLSKIENGTLALNELIDALPESSEKGWTTMAITGAPGVGKSVLVDALMTAWASEGHKVALLAVDPSSPLLPQSRDEFFSCQPQKGRVLCLVSVDHVGVDENPRSRPTRVMVKRNMLGNHPAFG